MSAKSKQFDDDTKMFVEQRGQIQEEIVQSEDTMEEERNSTEDMGETQADTTPNYEGGRGREKARHTITIRASVGQKMKAAIKNLQENRKISKGI